MTGPGRTQSTRPHRAAPALVLIPALAFAVIAWAAPPRWQPLANDDIHDPKSPAIDILQEPADALSALPPDSAGTGAYDHETRRGAPSCATQLLSWRTPEWPATASSKADRAREASSGPSSTSQTGRPIALLRNWTIKHLLRRPRSRTPIG